MGGCCADYCTNSAKKGFQMCRLPRDKTRMKVWIDNIDRKDWVPGLSSTLCHVHFTEDKWEKTRDGKRRLKSDAVPTIFGERIIPVQTIQQAVHESAQIELETEDVPSQLSEIEESGTEASHELPLQQIHFDKDDEISNLQKRLSRLEKLFEASEKSKLRYKKELHTANRRIKILEDRIRNLQVGSSSTALNEDQIKVLTKTYKKIPRWCNETLMNAYKLRSACGTAGYEEILRQKLPYPCIRTLTKKLKNFK
ncbi:uncharacterized protein LOC143367443 [Andrena cerasifolii]|uniref:uncharacterized protein LOC143367443 n=1 Tax=Andrena cerasifolii TaxID=2819439 RepID=UPI004037DE66